MTKLDLYYKVREENGALLMAHNSKVPAHPSERGQVGGGTRNLAVTLSETCLCSFSIALAMRQMY